MYVRMGVPAREGGFTGSHRRVELPSSLDRPMTSRSRKSKAPPAPASPAEAAEPPAQEVLLAMREHSERVHGRDFDLYRDVFFVGNRRDGTVFDWRALTAAKPAVFWCKDCPTSGAFLVGDVAYGTAERNSFLRMFDPHVQALLAGAPPQAHDALIEAYDRRELGPALLAATGARARRQTAMRNGPAFRRRRDGFCEYFLRAYEEHGTVEKAIESLIELHGSDIGAYRKVLGTGQLFGFETMRHWMRRIPLEERASAKQRWREKQPRDRAERLAAVKAKRTR